METINEQAALDYHQYPHPGKIEVVPTKPYNTPEDLSLAYSPGVAYPCSQSIAEAYGLKALSFGLDYILPKPFDRRLLTVVAPAVIEAAEESGVARRKIEDMDAYRKNLEQIICTNDALINYLIKTQSVCIVNPQL